MTPPEGAPPAVSRAFILADRFLALAVDVGLFVAGYDLSFIAFCTVSAAAVRAPAALLQRVLAAFWASLFCYYEARFLSRGGQTLGKRLLGLKVIDQDGANPAFGAAFARALGYIASSTFLNLGFLWAAFDKDGRTWHDLLAGTRVVEAKAKSPRARRLLFGLAVVLAAVGAAVELNHAFH